MGVTFREYNVETNCSGRYSSVRPLGCGRRQHPLPPDTERFGVFTRSFELVCGVRTSRLVPRTW
jgi:hypothetical protein